MSKEKKKFVLLMVFQINCSPLDLFSDFLGIKAELNAIRSVDKLLFPQSSNQVRHVENKQKKFKLF